MEVNDVHRRLSSPPPPVYQQVITTIAGVGSQGFNGDDGPAANSQLASPQGVVVDNLGNVFVADTQNNRVRMITKATGIITTIAGGQSSGFSGDGGPATLASLNQPNGVAIDSSGGFLFISDSGNHVVRLVVLITKVITTWAGTGTSSGYSGDNGPATLSKLAYPSGIALDGKGNLYICDTNNNAVRLVNKVTGLITTVAQTSSPKSVTVDTLGNFYIADSSNNVVRLVTNTGIITTFAGGGSCCTTNGPATSAYLQNPSSVALDAAGNLYISTTSSNGVVLLVTQGMSIIATFAGGNNGNNGNGDNGPSTSSSISIPGGLAVDAGGSLYIADTTNNRVRQVSYLPTCGAGTYVSGSGSTCVGCPMGTYSGTTTSSGCLMCAAGTWTASTGSQSCNPCNAGSFASNAGATSCTACLSGYSSPSGATQCSICPSGKYSPTSGSSTCTTCGYGLYSGVGSSSCNSCGAGTYVNSGGTCTNCVAGSYSSSSGQSACAPCPTGLYSSSAGAASCSLCLKGQYSTTPGSSTCATCPSGQTSTPGSSFCFTATVPPASTTTPVPTMSPTYSYELTTVDANTYAIPPSSFVTMITTYAGNGVADFSGDGAAATSAQINSAFGVVLDISGNLYIADTSNHRIRLVMKNTGVITTYAGTSSSGYNNDGVSATSAYLNSPFGVALDSTGTLLYIADRDNHRIRLVTKGTTSNIITTFAGTGRQDFGGDLGAATDASFSKPSCVAVDISGLVYIADTENNRIRVVSIDGFISTIAGNGNGDSAVDNIEATTASLWRPYGVAIDSTGAFLYIADSDNSRIRLVTIGTSSNIITTYAGTGTGHGYGSFAGDGGAATSAQLYGPRGVALDSSNNLYIADTGNNRIRLVTKGISSNIITTFAGNGGDYLGGNSGDFGPPTSAALLYSEGVALDISGNLYIADIFRVRAVVTQTYCSAGFYYDGTTGCRLCAAGTYKASSSSATTCTPCPAGASSALGSTTCSYCTNGFYSPVPGSTACISCPIGFASSAGYGARSCDDVCAPGYYSGGGSSSVGPLSCSACSPGTYSSNIGATSCISCGAGTYSTATAAAFCIPCPPGATSSSGSTACNVVTTITTYAGNGAAAYGGDTTAATSAQLYSPQGVAVDISGNLYFADSYNFRIRLVMKNTGVITTYAGSGTTSSYTGDGGPATNAGLGSPNGVALDSTGTLLYIADGGNNRIRLVTKGTTSNIITNFAGGTAVSGSSAGFLGDGAAATSAQLNSPVGVAVDRSGLVYIADLNNHRIRVVSSNGIIRTIAGSGISGSAGDRGPATSANLFFPRSVAIDSTGTFLYIADTFNNRIRLVTMGTSSNTITTYAGSGTAGSGGDGRPATSAQFNSPRSVALDSSNNLYISDTGNHRIRLVTKGTKSNNITTYAGNGNIGYSGDFGPPTSASLNYPQGVALDTAGNVYIADSNNNRVRVVTVAQVGGALTPTFLPSRSPSSSPTSSSPTALLGPGGGGSSSSSSPSSSTPTSPFGSGPPTIAPTASPTAFYMSSTPVGGGTSPPITAATLSPTAFYMPTAPIDGGGGSPSSAPTVYSPSLAYVPPTTPVNGGSFPPSFPPISFPAPAPSSEGGPSSFPQAGSAPSQFTAPSSGSGPSPVAEPSSGSGPVASCVAGTYTSINFGSPTCAYCPPSTYSLAGASACTPCPQGSVSGAFASACTPCPSGSYSTAGATCTVCPAGSFSATTGASACSSCPSGQFSSPGASVCSSCPSGSYSTAGAPCAVCPAGSLSAAAGASACSSCPNGQFSSPGASSCSSCSA